VISVDRRLVPGEVPEAALREVETVLDTLRARHSDLHVRSILPAIEDYPVGGTITARLADVAQEACRRTAGTGELRGVPYGTDASELFAAGIPCVVLGPGSIAQAHAVDEFVEIAQVEKAVEIYRSIMLSY
jgi:acetylornithine deacetylase